MRCRRAGIHSAAEYLAMCERTRSFGGSVTPSLSRGCRLTGADFLIAGWFWVCLWFSLSRRSMSVVADGVRWAMGILRGL